MAHSEESGQPTSQPGDITLSQATPPSLANPIGTMAPAYVYALGQITPRYPSLSLEKEIAQAAGRAGGITGLTDTQALQTILLQKTNRYLLRQLCWVLTIEGVETYLLLPRDPADFDLLAESLRPTPSPTDLDVVIGLRGPLAPPEFCNGLIVPVVAFDQIYSFDRASLLKSIPRPENVKAEEFEAAAAQLLDRVMQMTDNAGALDEHRALNYLLVRYPTIYTTAVEAFNRNASLTGVTVRSSPLSGVRNIVEVIFCYTNRRTDVPEKFFVRVDVTEEFPFLITKLSPYFDR